MDRAVVRKLHAGVLACRTRARWAMRLRFPKDMYREGQTAAARQSQAEGKQTLT